VFVALEKTGAHPILLFNVNTPTGVGFTQIVFVVSPTPHCPPPDLNLILYTPGVVKLITIALLPAVQLFWFT
jgi:hypothetical protein